MPMRRGTCGRIVAKNFILIKERNEHVSCLLGGSSFETVGGVGGGAGAGGVVGAAAHEEGWGVLCGARCGGGPCGGTTSGEESCGKAC